MKKPPTLKATVQKAKKESAIVAECCSVLDAMRIPYSVTNASLTNFGPDGTLRRRKTGIKKGWPDIVACRPFGWFVGIECKKPGQKQRPEQAECQKEIERVGGYYWLIHSAEELKARLEGRT